MPKVFLDTNILVYQVDTRLKEKQEVVDRLLASLAIDDIQLSTQVLKEFYNTLNRKLGVSPADARSLVRAWSRYAVRPSSPAQILNAIDATNSFRISFWDALIVEAAAETGCTILYSEDMSHGQRIRGVQVVNPFL